MEENALALVTGASSGIGRELAIQLAQKGCRVLATGRDPERLAETVRAGGLSVTALCADLSTHQGCEAIIAATRAIGTPLDLLVNNAALQSSLDFGVEALSPARKAAIDAEIAVNLRAPIVLVDALLPLLRRPGGTIVNVTSVLARHPRASAPVYSATKAALASVTRSLQHQLRPMGIHVVDAVPPLVDTPMTSGRGRFKISASTAAEGILRGLSCGRREIGIGAARHMLLLDRLAPAAVARILIGS